MHFVANLWITLFSLWQVIVSVRAQRNIGARRTVVLASCWAYCQVFSRARGDCRTPSQRDQAPPNLDHNHIPPRMRHLIHTGETVIVVVVGTALGNGGSCVILLCTLG